MNKKRTCRNCIHAKIGEYTNCGFPAFYCTKDDEYYLNKFLDAYDYSGIAIICSDFILKPTKMRNSHYHEAG